MTRSRRASSQAKVVSSVEHSEAAGNRCARSYLARVATSCFQSLSVAASSSEAAGAAQRDMAFGRRALAAQTVVVSTSEQECAPDSSHGSFMLPGTLRNR
jgi:hypothetical protein